METPSEEFERYLHVAHSDPNREDILGDYDRIEPANVPEKQLDVSDPTFGEMKDVIKKVRTIHRQDPMPSHTRCTRCAHSQADMGAPERSLEKWGCFRVVEGS